MQYLFNLPDELRKKIGLILCHTLLIMYNQFNTISFIGWTFTTLIYSFSKMSFHWPFHFHFGNTFYIFCILVIYNFNNSWLVSLLTNKWFIPLRYLCILYKAMFTCKKWLISCTEHFFKHRLALLLHNMASKRGSLVRMHIYSSFFAPPISIC